MGIARVVKDTADSQEIRYQVCFVSEKLTLQELKPIGLAKC
jgi:hypothetical protein